MILYYVIYCYYINVTNITIIDLILISNIFLNLSIHE